jgi:hypothetical protein
MLKLACAALCMHILFFARCSMYVHRLGQHSAGSTESAAARLVVVDTCVAISSRHATQNGASVAAAAAASRIPRVSQLFRPFNRRK